jgi:protein-S-isoprenylcysteine O-methyltransferase Ste14
MTFVQESVVAALIKPYVESHPIGIVWLVALAVYGVIELAGAVRERAEATRKDRGSRIVIGICVIPGAILLVVSPTIAPAAEIPVPLVFALAGIAIFTAGEALRVWSKVALGRYFTYTVMTSSDQPVITSGPYRTLRHPSYSGLLLIVTGIGAAWGNWLGLAALTLTTLVGLAYRIHVEEKALLEELGDGYRAYAEQHKRLIPFIW